jgi:hypothetical protein
VRLSILGRRQHGLGEDACRGLVAFGVGVGCFVAGSALAAATVAGAPALAVGALVAGALVGVGPGIISAVGYDALNSTWRSVSERLEAAARKGCLPENHDLARALRRAHLLALRYCVEQCKADVRKHSSEFDEAAMCGFFNAAERWIKEQLKLADSRDFFIDAPVAVAVREVVDLLASAMTDHSLEGAFDRLRLKAAAAAFGEFSDGLKLQVPVAFKEWFDGQGDFAPGWQTAAIAFFAEQLKIDQRLRTVVFLDRINALLAGQANAEEHLNSALQAILGSTGDLGRKLDGIEAKIDELIRRGSAHLDQSACNEALLSGMAGAEAIDNVARQLRMAFPRGQSWAQTAAQVRARMALLATPFYGREDSLRVLDTFIDSRPCGLLILTAPLGSGKSALVAHWVEQRMEAGDIVARHFISTQFDKTTAPETAIGHLIVQVREADNDDETTVLEGAEALGQALYDLLTATPKDARRRIILLDGLDEATAVILPFVETVVAEGTYVIVSARAEKGATPLFLIPWLRRLKCGLPGARIELEGVSAHDVLAWLEDVIPECGASEQRELANRIWKVSDGLPLFVGYLLDDVSSRMSYPQEHEGDDKTLSLTANLPASFTEYIRMEIEQPSQKGEPVWTAEIKSVFSVLSQCLGAIPISELQQIVSAEFEPDAMPLRYRRWLSISDRQLSYAHPLLTHAFGNVLGEAAVGRAKQDLISWAMAAWKPRVSTDPLFSSGGERGAIYPVRWLLPHLLGLGEAGQRRAQSLLLDPLWLENKICASAEFVFDIPRDFARVVGAMPQGEPRLLLELIDEALRSNLHFIAAKSNVYRQALLQSVLNHLEPLLSARQRNAPRTDVAPTLAANLEQLTSAWIQHARNKGRSWISLKGLDRERVFLGSMRWQAKMPERVPARLAFSPSGEMLAAAATWPYGNRTPPPARWSMAYDIVAWQASDGKVLNRLVPNEKSVPFDDPPEDVPRPAELDPEFHDYFDRRKNERESPRTPPQISLDYFRDFGEALKVDARAHAERAAARQPLNIGYGWQESLIAGDIRAVCWLDDDVVLAGSRGGRIFGFDVGSGSQTFFYQGTNVDSHHELREWNDIRYLSLARLHSAIVVAGTSYGSLQVIDFGSHSAVARTHEIDPFSNFVATRNWVYALDIHPSSRHLAVGLADYTIRVLEPHKFEEVCKFIGHTNSVVDVAWSPCGKWLASISLDKTLRVWSLDDGREVFPPIVHPQLLSLSWGLADEEIITAWNCNGIGGAVRVWSVATGALISEFGNGPALIEAIVVSRKTRLVAVGCKDGYVRAYVPEKPGIKVTPARCHSAVIRAAAHCVFRNELATVSIDGVLVWSLETWDMTRNYKFDWSEFMSWNNHITYSPDGKHLAVVVGHVVNMFEGDTLALRWSKSFSLRDIARCFFSADGSRFLTDDGNAQDATFIDQGDGCVVWDVDTGEVIDRSGATGSDAEDRLLEYNRAVSVVPRSPVLVSGVSDDGTTTNWKSWTRKEGNSGITAIGFWDAAGQEQHLWLAGIVRKRFQLSEVGEWALIFEGGSAPVRAKVACS